MHFGNLKVIAKFLVPLVLLFSISCAKKETNQMQAEAYNPEHYYAPVMEVPGDEDAAEGAILPDFANQGVTATPPKVANKTQTVDKPATGLEIKEVETPSTIRILIFPHLGTYAIPQGRESIVNEVTLKATSGECVMTSAQTGAVLKKSEALKIKLAEVQKPAWVQCANTAKLIRNKGLTEFEYRGKFLLKAGKSKAGKTVLKVVLHLPFEEYLRGVVPAEIPPTWNTQALKAQAIAARSYALYQLGKEDVASHDDYDFDDTIAYQAFLGVTREHPATDSAVKETKAIALTYNGSPIQAFFSADSGGYTESTENAWNVAYPYCPSKPEEYDLKALDSAWDYSIPLEKLSRTLSASGIIAKGLKLTDIHVVKQSKSSRALSVQLKLSNNSNKLISGPRLQSILRMKSNRFKIVRNGSTVKFIGSGFGHGVGLNQSGASVLGKKYDWDYKKILAFYYKK